MRLTQLTYSFFAAAMVAGILAPAQVHAQYSSSNQTSGMFGTRSLGSSWTPSSSSSRSAFGSSFGSSGSMSMGGMSSMNGMSSMSGMGSNFGQMSGTGSVSGFTQSGFVGADSSDTPTWGGVNSQGTNRRNSSSNMQRNLSGRNAGQYGNYGQYGSNGQNRGYGQSGGYGQNRRNGQYGGRGQADQQSDVRIQYTLGFETQLARVGLAADAIQPNVVELPGLRRMPGVTATYDPGGTLTLHGEVANAYERGLAIQLAMLEPGVAHVIDAMTVAGSPEINAEEATTSAESKEATSPNTP